jgi:thiamine-phosphate pyrophosphorylase
VQLREKDLDGGPLLAIADSLVRLCRRHGAKLLVNDRIDVALAAGADGVVLPAASFPTDVARRLLGPGRIVARSTHSAEEVSRAAGEGCDLALYGPVFETPAKAGFGEPRGLGGLGAAASGASIPVYAIGGIDAGNARSAIAAGAGGVAVIRAVMAAADPAAAVTGLLEAVSSARGPDDPSAR